jgi:hypothetical protein
VKSEWVRRNWMKAIGIPEQINAASIYESTNAAIDSKRKGREKE